MSGYLDILSDENWSSCHVIFESDVLEYSLNENEKKCRIELQEIKSISSNAHGFCFTLKMRTTDAIVFRAKDQDQVRVLEPFKKSNI